MKDIMLPKFSLPSQLLLVLGFVIFYGSYIPVSVIQFFYTISLLFKECLNFLLPVMVFSFICSGIVSLKKDAPVVIGILLCCVFISNIITPLIAYFACTSLLTSITSNITIQDVTSNTSVTPFFTITLPSIINSKIAIFSALTFGTFCSYIKITLLNENIHAFKKLIEDILNNIFIPILPLYVLGFLLDLHHSGAFITISESYGKTFLLLIAMQFILIFALYFIASGLHLNKTVTSIKNASSSYLTAFGAMSSAAAIPVTIKCAKKNTGNKPLAQVATPILANIHLFGDAITIPIFATVTLYLFNGTIISLHSFITFIFYFSLMMLGASGVPGGGMIICMPILKSVLGLSDAMTSIMITLHLLQDGFGTGTNVMGDGALMIIINNILRKMRIR